MNRVQCEVAQLDASARCRAGRKPFKVCLMCKPLTGEQEWCFCWGDTVVGVGTGNQRWFPSKDAVIAALTACGITPDEYDVIG